MLGKGFFFGAGEETEWERAQSPERGGACISDLSGFVFSVVFFCIYF